MSKLQISATVRGWAADPNMMWRLEQLVKYTQRTETIQQLLCIPEAEIKILREQIKVVVNKLGLAYSPPRGRTSESYEYTAQERTAIAVLLALMSRTTDSGLGLGANGSLVSVHVLDQLLATYHQYLSVAGTTAETAAVSFEVFIRAWHALQQGNAIAESCSNCGGVHYVFLDAPSAHCPVCSTLPLSELVISNRRYSDRGFNSVAMLRSA